MAFYQPPSSIPPLPLTYFYPMQHGLVTLQGFPNTNSTPFFSLQSDCYLSSSPPSSPLHVGRPSLIESPKRIPVAVPCTVFQSQIISAVLLQQQAVSMGLLQQQVHSAAMQNVEISASNHKFQQAGDSFVAEPEKLPEEETNWIPNVMSTFSSLKEAALFLNNYFTRTNTRTKFGNNIVIKEHEKMLPECLADEATLALLSSFQPADKNSFRKVAYYKTIIIVCARSERHRKSCMSSLVDCPFKIALHFHQHGSAQNKKGWSFGVCMFCDA